MSEDGIHGTPMSREKFARDHPDYNNPNAKAHPPVRQSSHPGGRSPIPDAPPKQKHAAVPTTQEHSFTKKTCHLTAVKVLCEHQIPKPRYAAEEEAGKQENKQEAKHQEGENEGNQKELSLSVVPHGEGAAVVTQSRVRKGDAGQPLSDRSLDKFSEEGKSDLSNHRQQIMQNYEKVRGARVLKNKNLYRNVQYRMMAHSHRSDQKQYSKERDRFMKTYGDHVHAGAELYFDQGDPSLEDVLTLEAQMSRHCSKHPQWAVWDCSTNEWVDAHQGTPYKTHALLPPVIENSYLEGHSVLPSWAADPANNAYWLKGIEPRRYKIHLYTCEGDQVTHVNVYPLASSGIDFKISRESGSVKPKPGTWSARMHECQDKWEKAVGVFNKVAPGGKIHVEVLPEATLSVSNGWKEEEGSHEAVWFGKIGAKGTLFELRAMKSVLDSLPGYISDIIKECTDVGIDVGLDLTVELNVNAEWTHVPEQKAQKPPNVAGGLEGVLVGKADFYAEARFFGEDLCGVHVTGSTTFRAVSEFEFESEEGGERIKISLFMEWQEPFTLLLAANYLHYTKKYQATFFKERIPRFHCCDFDLLKG